MKAENRPGFSIVTPSFNMLDYLKRCHASVMDQGGVSVQHIVKDGGSTDGTAAWLKKQSTLCYEVCEDDGMYDALNQGLDMAQGGIIGHLNCDEQYLPATLSCVSDFFRTHPGIDMLFGDVLLVDPDGILLAFRKAYPLRWHYVASSHLYVFTCALFFKRRVFETGMRFDKSYRSIGDRDFVVRALRHGFRAAHLNRYLSAFTITGRNLSADEVSKHEGQLYPTTLPLWVRVLRFPLNALRLMEKTVSGAYHQEKPLSYQVYVDDLEERSQFEAKQVSFAWPVDVQ